MGEHDIRGGERASAVAHSSNAVAPGRTALGEGATGEGPPGDGPQYSAPSVFAQGAPLPDAVREKFEGSLGTDLGNVRVHTGAAAAGEARRQGAAAFATGNNIAVDTAQVDPGSPAGEKILAEEVAHTVQQRGGSTPAGGPQTTKPDDPVEKEAQGAASAMVDAKPAQVSPSPVAIARSPAPAGPVTPPPPPSMVNSPIADQADKPSYANGTSVGYWSDTVQIKIVKFHGFYNSEEEALAVAHSGGAVVCVKGRYEAYLVNGDAFWDNFEYKNVKILNGTSNYTTVFVQPPFSAITTRDSVVLRSVYYNPIIAKQNMTPELMLKPGESPFGGFAKLFGNDKKTLGDDELFAAFTAAMKKGGIDILRQSEAQVNKKKDQFKYKETGPGEFKLIRSTAKRLADYDKQINEADREANEVMVKEPKELDPPDFAEKKRAARQRAAALRQERALAVQDYPMLARQDPTKIQNASDTEIAKLLGDDTIQIGKDIVTARDDLLTGSLDPWGIPGLVDSTIAGCGITDKVRRDKIKAHAAALAKSNAIAKGIQTAFAVGLGLVASFATGGLALVAAAGALGLSTYDAMATTKAYATDKAAANTDLNPDLALAVKDVDGDWKWVALAWVGVGLDVGSVASALKGVKSIGEVAKAGEQLAKGSEELLKKLKVAAGIVKEGELITEVTRGVVGMKLGASLEIKAGMGTQVHVLYEVEESTGRVFVKGVVAGAEATIHDILAHAETVKLLNRYEGVTGAIREVAERFLSIAPKEADAIAQFPKGSQAFESYFEVQKLKKIIKSRMASLEKGAGKLSLDAEEGLRRDISFLEDELKRHQKVVDDLALEKGSGFIAKGEHVTKEAIEKGHMPNFKDPQYGIPPEHYQYYYYRRDGATYELCTMQDAPAEVKRFSVVEEGGTKKLIAGRKPPTLTIFGPNDVDAAFTHLTTNSPSFKDYYPAMQKAGVSEAAVKAELKNLLKNGELSDEMLRGALKEKFRPDILKWVKDENRLKALYGADPLWKKDPATALRKYSHKDLMETTAKLDNKDASRLEELWYADSTVNPQMAGALEKQTGIMIGNELRIPDNICKNGEIVDIKGGASLYDWDQLKGFLSRVGQETTTQSGHVFTPKTVRIAALNPDGVKANAAMMRQYLDKGLVVEIYNARSESKIISSLNAAELEDDVLLKWLYPAKKTYW